MTADSTGRVRQARDDEKGQLRHVIRRAFGWLPSLLFDAGKASFVYELDGKIVGGITLSSFSIDRQRVGGVVKWLFVLPEARGRGAASALVDRALAWFAEEDCQDLFTCVEGHNTSSSNRFARAGFRILSFCEQVRLYGIRLPRVWYRTFHLADVGHFLWARRHDDAQDAVNDAPTLEALSRAPRLPAAAVAGTTVTLILLGLLMVWRQGQALTVSNLWHPAVVVVGLLGLRLGAMALAARRLGLPVLYRSWETGLLLSAFIALTSGGVFIAPGSLYPARRVWSYREWLPKLGPVALAGALALLLAGWGLQAMRWWVIPEESRTILDLALFYVRAFVLFDVLLVFFPFVAFNGRRILDWQAGMWALLAVATVALWVLGFVV